MAIMDIINLKDLYFFEFTLSPVITKIASIEVSFILYSEWFWVYQNKIGVVLELI